MTASLHSLVMLLLLARALGKLAFPSWGYDCQTLRTTYIASGRSKVEYGASSWLPWISDSTLENLERSQRYVGQAITGHLRTTPVEAILAEANLPSIGTRAIHLNTIAMEKSPSWYGNVPNSLAGVKKQVMSGDKSLVMLSPPRHHNLRPHGLTQALIPLS